MRVQASGDRVCQRDATGREEVRKRFLGWALGVVRALSSGRPCCEAGVDTDGHFRGPKKLLEGT
jgi:hypothetical protein